MRKIGCDNVYDFTECEADPEEENFADYVNLDEVRKAIHVGSQSYRASSLKVYFALLSDNAKSQKDTVEFLLDHYPVRSFKLANT